MKKKISKLMTLALVISVADLSYAKKMKTEDLSNMVIQGENRLTVRATVPDMGWEPEVFKDLKDLSVDASLINSMKPPSLINPPVELPDKMKSAKTASPWVSRIYDEPVLTLEMTAPKNAKKQEYTFLVKNSDGRVFYSLKKSGAVPEKIEWRGLGDSGKPLSVGFDYSYSFSMLDEAGNPQRYAGKPFRLDAFRYKTGSKRITSLYPEAVFAERSSLKVSDEGFGYLTEIKDSIREQYAKKIEIVVFEDDTKFGLARSKVIKDYLAKALDLPESQLAIQVQPLAKGENYRHIDIVEK